MKVDKRFYYFGCGASGDVIDFVSMYFNLSVKDAAGKLAADYGLVTDENEIKLAKSTNPTRCVKKEPNVSIQKITKAFRTVADYANILKEWKKIYAPKGMDEEWNEHFVEALDQWTKSEYLEDGLLFGSHEEINDFYEQYNGEVEKIGQRVIEIEESRNQRNTYSKRKR
ncbi:CHC2 zinc finger domain-containing protein [Lachnospiraceae bacterium LCP25S3_G4]